MLIYYALNFSFCFVFVNVVVVFPPFLCLSKCLSYGCTIIVSFIATVCVLANANAKLLFKKINSLEREPLKQAWYVDDAAAGGSLKDLKAWWDRLTELVPDYGYFPNASKSWPIVKEEHLPAAERIFHESGIAITKEGGRYLGGAIGTRTFVETYPKAKITEWPQEVNQLSSIAVSQPHVAYTAFTHGLVNKWTFLSRTIPNVEELFTPLEVKIRTKVIPSLSRDCPKLLQ